VCAGWLATPEARMACCADGQTCPMHKSDADDTASARVISQAEADSCCAASEKDSSAPSPSTFVLNVSLAIVPSPVHMVVAATAVQPDAWRTLTPLPTTHVPKHLLLSVFLV
jgi:hypothetical protein